MRRRPADGSAGASGGGGSGGHSGVSQGESSVGPAPLDVVEVAAPAKINLGLLVGPVRSDGYHEIFSLMTPVTLADLVTARPAPAGAGLAVECDVAPGERNLAHQMVRELERRLERAFDVSLTITKRVPTAAGLGGGSSDAAAALVAVERLFGLELEPRLRHEIAGAIGSDVPFFLWPGPQLAMGRGTILKDVVLPEPLHIVIALPDLALPTADVYRWLDEDAGAAGARAGAGKSGPHPGGAGSAAERERRAFVARTQRLLSVVQAARRPRDLTAIAENDLEAPVARRHPAIAELGRRLRDAGAFAAAMSGSGSSVFGLFGSAASAQGALAALAPTGAVYVTDLQPREEPGSTGRRRQDRPQGPAGRSPRDQPQGSAGRRPRRPPRSR